MCMEIPPGLAVILIMLNFDSNLFHHFQTCQSLINSLVKDIEDENVILLNKFASRLTDIMKSSIQPDGSKNQCNIDKLIESLSKNLRKFDFLQQENTQVEREENLQKFLKLISVKVRKETKDLVTCVFHQIQPRQRRNFIKDENQQILRQIASQLFYNFNSIKNRQINELQVLHVLHKGKTKYIFLAINQLDDKKSLQEIQRKLKEQTLQQLTTFRYEPSEANGNENNKKGKEKIKADRSKRHAGKLKQRVFNNTEGNNLIEFIRKNHAKCKIIEFPRSISLNAGIYFVKPQDKPREEHKSHPEEQLCDLVQLFRRLPQPQEWNFQIYGKNRPCFSCFGRLEERNKHQDLKFCKNPGYLSIPHLLKQNLNVQIKTVQKFISFPSHVSVDGGRVYTSQGFLDDESLTNQSDSDSEIEELPETTKPKSSLCFIQLKRWLIGQT